MPTLLFQLVGPLQAWDTQSHLEDRMTEREPSKSGVVGLLSAALGVERGEIHRIAELAQLNMGVRIDREGHIVRDFHTAGKDGYVGSDGKLKDKNLITSTRYYLADAMFLVGVEGDLPFLEGIQEALRRPQWSLFLGRKSCPPSRPPYLKNGLSGQPLYETLKGYPWLGQSKREYELLRKLRIVMDDRENGNELRNDHPVNFQLSQRSFHPRRITTRFVYPPELPRFDPMMSYPLIRDIKEAAP